MSVVFHKVGNRSQPRPNPHEGNYGNGCTGCNGTGMTNGGSCTYCSSGGIESRCEPLLTPPARSTTFIVGAAGCDPVGASEILVKLKDCRAPVYITCPTHRWFKIDPDTSLVFFFNFGTCAFEPDPSQGGCPRSYSQPYAVQEDDGTWSEYVDLADGTYRITPGQATQPPTFARADCPSGCVKRVLKWDETTIAPDVLVVFTGPIVVNDLDINSDLADCGV